jgi:polysaccharide transporter, PST family
MRRLATKLASNSLVQNAAMLYGAQLGRKLLPLLIIPYLARTLGPEGWGAVAFAQSLGEFIVLTIEFGFSLSATRAIARNRESRETCGSIAAGVLGAQVLLAAAGIGAAILVGLWIPVLRDHPRLLAAALFYAVAQGMAPLWLLQGLERMRLAVTLEVSGRLIGLALLFVFVHSPQDDWRALLIQGVAPAVSTVAGLLFVYRDLRWCRPRWSSTREAFAEGWPMFVFRSAESLYGVGNAFILGLFAPQVQVGYFASAEKISKAAFGLLNPIREALYPRLANMVHASRNSAARLARIGILVMVAGGLLLGMFIFFAAPLLIRLLMGRAFAPAVIVLRILAVLPPVLSVTYSVGLQWLLPLGRDAQVNQVILRAGCLNLVLATTLARSFGHIGMAVSIVCAELFVAISMVRVVVRSTTLFRFSESDPELSPQLAGPLN